MATSRDAIRKNERHTTLVKTLHSIRTSLAALAIAAGVLSASVLPTFADSPVPLAEPAAPPTCAGYATTTTLNQQSLLVTAGSQFTISGVVTGARLGPVQIIVDGQLLRTVFLANSWPYGRFSYTVPGFSAQSPTVGMHTIMAQYEGYQGPAGTNCPSISQPSTLVVTQHW
jgi:hypothetical protein